MTQEAQNNASAALMDEILVHLSEYPMTIVQLADRCKRPYTTVQQATKALREQGKITKFDRATRNARWTLGGNNGPTTTIPSVMFMSKPMKMTQINNADLWPETLSNSAHSVVKAWITIAMTALRLNSGIPDEVLLKKLSKQKANLHTARSAFETMAFLCTQLIENPRFWEVTSLMSYSNDPDWDNYLATLKKLYEFYYPDPTNR